MVSAVNNSSCVSQQFSFFANTLAVKNNKEKNLETTPEAEKMSAEKAGVLNIPRDSMNFFVSNGVKSSALQAEINRGDAGPATREIAIDDSYRSNGDKVLQMRACTQDHNIFVWEDRMSTPENPVMYVEIRQDGELKAYQIAVNEIDLSSMTRAEGIALLGYSGNTSNNWGGLTYFAMTNICMNYEGEMGVRNAFNGINPDFQERINFFEECRENYVRSNESLLSVGQAKTAIGSLYAAQYDKAAGVQEQLAKVKEIMDRIDKIVSPENWGQPKQSARRIEDFLLEMGKPWQGNE